MHRESETLAHGEKKERGKSRKQQKEILLGGGINSSKVALRKKGQEEKKLKARKKSNVYKKHAHIKRIRKEKKDIESRFASPSRQ